MKILKILFLFLFVISVALNFRLAYLWDQGRNDLHQQLLKRYFSDQLVLSKLRENKIQEGIDKLEEFSENHGGHVAINCMENGCDDFKAIKKTD